MKRSLLVITLVVLCGMFSAVQSSPAQESAASGGLHAYAPVSFWASAGSFLNDPALDEAYEAVADAADAMGKTCYDTASVKTFFKEMMSADFAAVAVNKQKSMVFYNKSGAMQAVCKYDYLGSQNAPWGEYTIEWHKYRCSSCWDPDGGKGSQKAFEKAHRYLVSTAVHQHGDEGMIHAHVRYGSKGFKDLMTNPQYDLWWPTLALYGKTTAEVIAADLLASPEEFASMLPDCSDADSE